MNEVTKEDLQERINTLEAELWLKEKEGHRRDICWYCGCRLIWQSDFNYDEVFGEGEGIVTYMECSGCGASVQYSQRTDILEEESDGKESE